MSECEVVPTLTLTPLSFRCPRAQRAHVARIEAEAAWALVRPAHSWPRGQELLFSLGAARRAEVWSYSARLAEYGRP